MNLCVLCGAPDWHDFQLPLVSDPGIQVCRICVEFWFWVSQSLWRLGLPLVPIAAAMLLRSSWINFFSSECSIFVFLLSIIETDALFRTSMHCFELQTCDLDSNLKMRKDGRLLRPLSVKRTFTLLTCYFWLGGLEPIPFLFPDGVSEIKNAPSSSPHKK